MQGLPVQNVTQTHTAYTGTHAHAHAHTHAHAHACSCLRVSGGLHPCKAEHPQGSVLFSSPSFPLALPLGSVYSASYFLLLEDLPFRVSTGPLWGLPNCLQHGTSWGTSAGGAMKCHQNPWARKNTVELQGWTPMAVIPFCSLLLPPFLKSSSYWEA